MNKHEGKIHPTYIQQFKKNFMDCLFWEEDIDEEALEDACSSVEKEVSNKLRTENDIGLKVKKNLFGTSSKSEVLKQKTVVSPCKDRSNSHINIQSPELTSLNQELIDEKIELSQTIKNRPGKFGYRGSPESLNKNKTPKRKRSPTKLNKFSPYLKRARLNNSVSIKDFFPVIKASNNFSINKANTNTVKVNSTGNHDGIDLINEDNLESFNELTVKSTKFSVNSTESYLITPQKSIQTSPSTSKQLTITPQKSIQTSPSTSRQSTPKSPKQAYVDIYNNLLLRFIQEMYFNTENYNHLLSSEEDGHIEAFRSLSITAQRIYGRLLSRKYDWIRVSSIKYPQVTNNLPEVIDDLERCRLVTLDNTTESLVDICNYLTVPELKSVCQFFKISFTKSATKPDIIEQLVIHSKQKRISFFAKEESGIDKIVRDKVLSTLGQCVKLEDEPRKTMFRCLLFFSYPHYRGLERDRFQDQLTLLSAWTKCEANFPEYNVFRSNLFPSREHLLEYEAALEMKSDLIENIETKNWDEALNIVVSVIQKYNDFIKNMERMNWVIVLPDFLRRFTSGAVYVSAINKGIDVLKRYDEYISEAKKCLRILINQDIFSVHRHGQWFEQLALLNQRNCKDNVKAAKVVFEGLKRKRKLDIVSRHILSTRATLLIGRKTNKLNDISKDNLRTVVEPNLSEPFSVDIVKQDLPSIRPGCRKIYIDDSEEGKTLTSVEEVARSHFQNQGYSQGLHDEGCTIKALALACFWDIIYGDVAVEGQHSLFHSNLQSEPLDWNTEGFYRRRKEAIEERLNELLGGINVIWSRIVECANQNMMRESVVNWKYLDKLSDQVKCLVECLNVNAFVAIARLLITNHAVYNSGFPDLTLWNPLEKKCLLVEVKSQNDSLSIKQKLWLHNLQLFSVPALVCHVKSVGCKSKKTTDSSP